MRYTTLNNNEIIPSLGIGTYRISPTDFYRIGANRPTRQRQALLQSAKMDAPSVFVNTRELR